MNGAVHRRVALLGLLGLCGGCAQTVEGKFDPALFPHAAVAAESRWLGRVAWIVRPEARDMVYVSAPDMGLSLRVRAGHIVEQALMTALVDTFQGAQQRMDEPPSAGSGFAATVLIEAVRFAYDRKLAWLSPVPIFPFVIGDSDFHFSLSFDVSVLDARGNTLWRRNYDGGREQWKRPSFWSQETMPGGVTRMAHATAWRLSQQLVTDLLGTLADERGKEREL
jgi:hypothetical protein